MKANNGSSSEIMPGKDVKHFFKCRNPDGIEDCLYYKIHYTTSNDHPARVHKVEKLKPGFYKCFEFYVLTEDKIPMDNSILEKIKKNSCAFCHDPEDQVIIFWIREKNSFQLDSKANILYEWCQTLMQPTKNNQFELVVSDDIFFDGRKMYKETDFESI